MNKTYLQFACLLMVSLLGLGLVGCDKAKKNNDKARSDGDPMVFVNNTLMNGNMGVPSYLFNEEHKWAMDIKGFAEGPAGTLEQGFSGRVPAVQGQNPSQALADYEPYKMQRSQRGSWSVYQSGKAANTRFEFDSANGLVTLNRIIENNVDLMVTEKFRVLHTSFTDDGKAMSFLLSSDIAGKRRLVAVYLYRWDPATATLTANTDAPYNYLYGKGYKVGWEKNEYVDLRICGSVSQDLSNPIRDALGQWKKALEGRLGMDVSEPLPLNQFTTYDQDSDKCRPFSDLNTKTITYVDGWSRPSDGQGRPAGETLTVADLQRGQIIDGDIFILMTEMQKIVPNGLNVRDPRAFETWQVRQEFLLTALGEVGELLGLGPVNGGSDASIMSASKNATDLTDYDVQAIQTLYPVKGFF